MYRKKKSNRPFIHYLIFYFRKRLMVILSDMGQAGSKGDIISAKRVLAKRLKVTECINYNYYSIYHFKNSRWYVLIWIKTFKKRQIIISLVKECYIWNLYLVQFCFDRFCEVLACPVLFQYTDTPFSVYTHSVPLELS